MQKFLAIVIGCSAGGQRALSVIFSILPENFPLPLVVVQHLSPDSSGLLASVLAERTRLRVKEAEDKEELVAGTIYLAPANYHLLIDSGGVLALSVDEKENHSRPSIDVLFDSAADVYGAALAGVILTGASSDGAAGARKIRECGGLVVVQDPETAESQAMPRAALESAAPEHVLPLEQIALLLASLAISDAKKASEA